MSRPGEEAPLPPETFDLVAVPAPPSDFAARVVAQAARAPVARRRGPLLGLGLGAAAAVLAAVWAIGGSARGEVTASRRSSHAIADRGIAVAEAGARLSWTERRGAVAVVQPEGNVFYRVEPAGFLRASGFEVATPAGRVYVEGTCFRVEVLPMSILNKQSLLSAGVGALGAAVVVVSVYEGRVRVSNAHGQIEVGAGERATTGSTPPRLLAEDEPTPHAAARASRGESSSSISIALGRTAPASAALEGAERQELVALREKVRKLEAGGAAAGEEGRAPSGDSNFIDPDKEELLRRAKTCGLAWDMPQLEPDDLDAKEADSYGLNEVEREIMGRVRKGFGERNLAELRRLYVEVTGNKAASEQLSASGMQQEILSKSPDGEAPQVFKRLSAEKAGLVPVTANANASPLERMMRMLTSAGDRFESELAAEMGPARAREIRKKKNGWNSRSGSSHGCPGQR